MDFMDILGSGSKVMILGLAAVFLALTIIVLVINILNKAVNKEAATEKKDKDINVEDNKLDEKQSTVTIDNEVTDDSELIAVITAAVAASLNRSTHNIIVRRVERIRGNRSQWNKAGRYEHLSSKL
ncbi:MAG: OadG family protein [Caldicoprobacterales bacterium]|jgi:sodium pump decarboxylase gamma subunit